ncbi:hypothetical protein OPT61_g10449 [Boeremia exigua]|uniref:Uncharacterized protein n=1 Tax=Boeremia exigua TaxID=749465 RepID=A0ACC2HPJ7_9PLEO|nr:hypothetical protein OPT61_g10449 [Boeremia exigua]
MQAYVSKPTPAYAQPAVRRRALDWDHYEAPYNRIWQTPAVFQQAVPGTYYAYVAPRRDVAYTYRRPLGSPPGACGQWFDDLGSLPLGSEGTRNVRGCSNPAHAASSRARKAEPVSLERDHIEVIEDYPLFTETTRRDEAQEKLKREEDRNAERTPQSSSTDLGTLSSGRPSSSSKDVLRDNSRYTQKPYRSKGRQGRDGAEPRSKGKRNAGGQGQATLTDIVSGRASPQVHMRGGGTDSGTFSEGGREREGAVQGGNATRDPSGVSPTCGMSGAATKEDGTGSPDHGGRPTQGAGSAASEPRCRREKDAVLGGAVREVSGERLTGMATAWKRRMHPQQHAEPGGVLPRQSRIKRCDGSILGSSRRRVRSTPASFVIDCMSEAGWGEGAGARRESHSSMSTELYTPYRVKGVVKQQIILQPLVCTAEQARLTIDGSRDQLATPRRLLQRAICQAIRTYIRIRCGAASRVDASA